MPIIVGGPLDYELNFSCDGRLWPRPCENARDFDANGTAHHFSDASVKPSGLSPHFGLVSDTIQIAISTDICDFSFHTDSVESRCGAVA